MSNTNQAHADPDRLRSFASELSLLATNIQDLNKDMERELVRLGNTWRDDEYDKFRSHFLNSRQKLTAFVEELRRNAPKIIQDAEEIAASQSIKLDT